MIPFTPVRAVNAIGSAGISSIASSGHQLASTTNRGTAISMKIEADTIGRHTSFETMIPVTSTATNLTDSSDSVLHEEISMPAMR